MNFSFDAAKDVANQSKHGLSLAFAAELEWSTLIASEDTRRPYKEVRMIGYALSGSRLFCVVFTDRGNTRRIISLRKANTREVKEYANQI